MKANNKGRGVKGIDQTAWIRSLVNACVVHTQENQVTCYVVLTISSMHAEKMPHLRLLQYTDVEYEALARSRL